MTTHTHLYVIRHGEALSHAQNTIGNTRLSPFGVKQAERLRNRLAATKEIAADILISSTMERARHTAEIIAPALGLPIVFDQELEEWRDGDAEAYTLEEYREAFVTVPDDQKPFARIVPNAENWVEFMLRVGVALNRITHEYEGKTIVLVCHGGVVDATFFLFMGLSTLQFPQFFFNTRNTSITHWCKGEKGDFADVAPWTLECYNDSMHLNDIGAATPIPWQALVMSPARSDDATTVPTEEQ